LPIHGDGATYGAAFLIDLTDFGVAGILYGKYRSGAEQLGQQEVEIFCAGTHHNLLRENGHPLEGLQVIRDGLPQGEESLVRGWGKEVVFRQDLSGQSGPGGCREERNICLIAAQIQPPDRGERIFGKGGGNSRGGEPLHGAGEESPLGTGIYISFCLQLLIGCLYRDDRDVQVFRQGAFGGQTFVGAQRAVENILADAAVQIFVQRKSASLVHVIRQHKTSDLTL
jgi:hypothetical protein